MTWDNLFRFTRPPLSAVCDHLEGARLGTPGVGTTDLYGPVACFSTRQLPVPTQSEGSAASFALADVSTHDVANSDWLLIVMPPFPFLLCDSHSAGVAYATVI